MQQSATGRFYLSSPYLLRQTEQSVMNSLWRRQISLCINLFSFSVIGRWDSSRVWSPICHTARLRKLNGITWHLQLEHNLMWPPECTLQCLFFFSFFYSSRRGMGIKPHLSCGAAPQILKGLIGLGHPWCSLPPQKSELLVVIGLLLMSTVKAIKAFTKGDWKLKNWFNKL